MATITHDAGRTSWRQIPSVTPCGEAGIMLRNLESDVHEHMIDRMPPVADDHGETCGPQQLEPVHIPLIAFLKTCGLIFWSAIRYPSKTTEIDLSLGQIVRRY
jgi:hypothetical protein